MKVISKPDASTWCEKVTCFMCKATLEVQLADLKLHEQQADRPSESNTWIGKYTCPECKSVGMVGVPRNFWHLVAKE